MNLYAFPPCRPLLVCVIVSALLSGCNTEDTPVNRLQEEAAKNTAKAKELEEKEQTLTALADELTARQQLLDASTVTLQQDQLQLQQEQDILQSAQNLLALDQASLQSDITQYQSNLAQLTQDQLDYDNAKLALDLAEQRYLADKLQLDSDRAVHEQYLAKLAAANQYLSVPENYISMHQLALRLDNNSSLFLDATLSASGTLHLNSQRDDFHARIASLTVTAMDEQSRSYSGSGAGIWQGNEVEVETQGLVLNNRKLYGELVIGGQSYMVESQTGYQPLQLPGEWQDYSWQVAVNNESPLVVSPTYHNGFQVDDGSNCQREGELLQHVDSDAQQVNLYEIVYSLSCSTPLYNITMSGYGSYVGINNSGQHVVRVFSSNSTAKQFDHLEFVSL